MDILKTPVPASEGGDPDASRNFEEIAQHLSHSLLRGSAQYERFKAEVNRCLQKGRAAIADLRDRNADLIERLDRMEASRDAARAETVSVTSVKDEEIETLKAEHEREMRRLQADSETAMQSIRADADRRIQEAKAETTEARDAATYYRAEWQRVAVAFDTLVDSAEHVISRTENGFGDLSDALDSYAPSTSVSYTRVTKSESSLVAEDADSADIVAEDTTPESTEITDFDQELEAAISVNGDVVPFRAAG